MALRAEAGNVERRYRNHCDAAGQRGDFIARTGAFHRDDDAAVGDVRKREARERFGRIEIASTSPASQLTLLRKRSRLR